MTKHLSEEQAELKALLNGAMFEIHDLRRRNEILSAKVEMIDLFACVLHTRPAEHNQGAAPDVARSLARAIAEIDKSAA